MRLVLHGLVFKELHGTKVVQKIESTRSWFQAFKIAFLPPGTHYWLSERRSWLLLVAIGVITIAHQNVKLLAFRFSDPSKLPMIAFLPNVWMFLIDWLLMGAMFTGQQFWGFGLLFAFNAIELYRFHVNLPDDDSDYLMSTRA